MPNKCHRSTKQRVAFNLLKPSLKEHHDGSHQVAIVLTPLRFSVFFQGLVRRGQDIGPQGELKGHLCHRIGFKEEMKDKKQTNNNKDSKTDAVALFVLLNQITMN